MTKLKKLTGMDIYNQINGRDKQEFIEVKELIKWLKEEGSFCELYDKLIIELKGGNND